MLDQVKKLVILFNAYSVFVTVNLNLALNVALILTVTMTVTMSIFATRSVSVPFNVVVNFPSMAL